MARPFRHDRENIRNVRLSVAVSQNDLRGLEALAAISGKSVNQIVAELVAQVVEKNSALIDEFIADRGKYQTKLNWQVDDVEVDPS